MSAIQIEQVEWQQHHSRIRPIREAVFIIEQEVPVELEWDGLDDDCLHLLAIADRQAVATARLAPGGKIGRMAVLAEWRRRGVGSMLVAQMIELARAKGHEKVVLDAQVHAIEFYQTFNFELSGERFIDAGIIHQAMYLQLR